MNRPSAQIIATILVLLAALAIGVTPAAAKVVHRQEGSFNGADAPEGPFGVILPGDAVDQSDGSVYVLESNFFGLGKGLIDKFDQNGAYASVQITGAETPQSSFAFTLYSGIAVDNSAGANKGDFYVADTEHGVVDRFKENGEFQCQITGKTPASLEEEENECNGALGSATPDGSIVPAGLAVDSSGDIYVADDAHSVIDKFGPSGEYIEQITDSHLTTEMGTIALDSTGNLYVANVLFLAEQNGSNVVKFDSAGSFISVFDENPSFGVGVDPATGRVEVGNLDIQKNEGYIAEYEASGTLLDTFASGSSDFSGLAVDETTGKIYATDLLGFSGARVQIFGPAIVVPDVTTGAATGVTETSATLNGHIDPDAAHGGGEVTSCRFAYGTTASYGQTGPCSPATPYSSPQDVSTDLPGLSPDTTYHYRLEAANANNTFDGGEDATFTTPGPPVIDSQTANSAATSATLTAQIDAFGYDTTCQLQYISDAGFQASGYANATTLPCNPSDLGSGFGDQTARVVLRGLQAAVTYHYRFIATSPAGQATGPDETFDTFGIESVSAATVDENGDPYTQAGGHPYALVTEINLNTTTVHDENGLQRVSPAGNFRDLSTDLPAGLLGNPTATPRCPREDLYTDFAGPRCPPASQVGTVTLLGTPAGCEATYCYTTTTPLYNVVPPAGEPARLAFAAVGVPVYLDVHVRSGEGYGITASGLRIAAVTGIVGVKVTVWGIPADPGHDAERECTNENGERGHFCPSSAAQPQVPFLTNPTSCSGPLTVTGRADSWQAPGDFVTATSTMPGFTGCDRLDFTPAISARPDLGSADSPAGFDFGLHLPQNENPNGFVEAHLKKAVVTLPSGLLVNPSSAGGLEGCSSAQIDLHGGEPAHCPDASKIGSVQIDTPLLDHPVPGAVYLASPHDNPFNSLLAIYIAVDDPASGVVVKLAGQVEPDPQTGQLTTTFSENPQLPFEDLKLHFFAGPRAPLRTPAICGSYTTASVLTPWSAPETGPPATPSDSFQITQAPGGGNCPNTAAEEPHKPAFEAGTETPTAGAYSPFVLHLARADGSQELRGIDTTLPPGLVGKLAGVAECPQGALEAAEHKSGVEEQANPSCSLASQVGTVNVGTGAGPSPYYVQGHAYLAGPYKGAPLSLAIITPAVAGPFDLGTVVVRAALFVNPETAQITAKSDPLPTILQGIPLDVRSIAIKMDRSQFTLNPTSCEKMAVGGEALSVLGQSASLTDPFQVGGCSVLPFHPKLKLSLKGGTKRSKHPALRAVLTAKPGEANIARAQVTLPHSEFLDQNHIRTVCTRVQFAEGSTPGEMCPAGSVYGHARAITPLLDHPLEGPAYLMSGFGHKLPDLAADLNGQIRVLLHGKVDTGRGGGIRNTFEVVPDAPVSKFTLSLDGGQKGLIQNSENICAKPQKALAHFVAQNGKVDNFHPLLHTSCKKRKARHHRRASLRHRRRGR